MYGDLMRLFQKDEVQKLRAEIEQLRVMSINAGVNVSTIATITQRKNWSPGQSVSGTMIRRKQDVPLFSFSTLLQICKWKTHYLPPVCLFWSFLLPSNRSEQNLEEWFPRT